MSSNPDIDHFLLCVRQLNARILADRFGTEASVVHRSKVGQFQGAPPPTDLQTCLHQLERAADDLNKGLAESLEDPLRGMADRADHNGVATIGRRMDDGFGPDVIPDADDREARLADRRIVNKGDLLALLTQLRGPIAETRNAPTPANLLGVVALASAAALLVTAPDARHGRKLAEGRKPTDVEETMRLAHRGAELVAAGRRRWRVSLAAEEIEAGRESGTPREVADRIGKRIKRWPAAHGLIKRARHGTRNES